MLGGGGWKKKKNKGERKKKIRVLWPSLLNSNVLRNEIIPFDCRHTDFFFSFLNCLFSYQLCRFIVTSVFRICMSLTDLFWKLGKMSANEVQFWRQNLGFRTICPSPCPLHTHHPPQHKPRGEDNMEQLLLTWQESLKKMQWERFKLVHHGTT